MGHCCGTPLWDTLVGRSCRSPATRGVYTSMFRAPLWHGATQTHFPPRPRKSAWHCDITNVMSPHGPPHTRSKHISHDTTNHPAHQRHAAFTHQHVSRSPEARRHANTLPTKAAQIPMALRHHERNFAARSAHTPAKANPHGTATSRK